MDNFKKLKRFYEKHNHTGKNKRVTKQIEKPDCKTVNIGVFGSSGIGNLNGSTENSFNDKNKSKGEPNGFPQNKV
jgi:hypothetical protein